jgi:hypothetical protein
MDMKHILDNMDAALRGEKPSAAASDVNDMKAILESFQAVDECGMGEMPMQSPAMSQPEDKVSMNVTLNARGDAVEDLIALMGGAKAPQDAPVRMPMPMPAAGPRDEEPDMAKLIALASDEHDHEDDMDEEWDNAPDEGYGDHTQMIHDLSGGINREKKAYKKAQDGDNAMALEGDEELEASLRESLKSELLKKYEDLSK